jgi:SAM-dependent methyltransferase
MNLGRSYDYRFRDVNQDDRQLVWNEIAKFVYEQMDRPAKILDPAAGRCEFLRALPAAEKWAIDSTEQPGQTGDRIKMIYADTLSAELPQDYFDGIFISNFLEHLPDHPTVARFLEKMWGALAPGGRIAILGPNFRHCVKEYFDFSDHIVPLTDVAVKEFMYGAGFEITAAHAQFLPLSFRSRLPASARMARLYLNLPLAWKFFGKQFLLFGKKPLIT